MASPDYPLPMDDPSDLSCIITPASPPHRLAQG
jgi:hypothetical protein